METTTLQIPLSKSLKSTATNVAREYGFSSLQEIVRVLLTKLARREINIQVTEGEYIKLAPKAELRYKQMLKDFKSGQNIFKSNNAEELLKNLRS